MQIYSPNMLKIFEQCPQKYNLKYNENISTVQNSNFFEKGKNIHALANYYLQGFDIEKMEKTLSKDEILYWENLKNNKYFKMNIINTEYNLSCKVGEYWVGGRLDALVCENEGYYILDYKTGEIPKNPEYDFQTMIYLLSADKFLNKKGSYKTLNFVYLGLKKNEEKLIELNSENKKVYEEKIIKTCKDIEKSKFAQSKTCCEKCEFKKLCE